MAKSFEEFNLNRQILNAVADAGYTVATSIQEKAIAPVLSGQDICGIAETGTGKTAAFVLPMLMKLKYAQGDAPRALILAPTRELAMQIAEEVKRFSIYTDLRSVVIFGGIGPKTQKEQIKAGVDIVIATPGRFLDIYLSGDINTKYLQFLVLDEADKILDLGFAAELDLVLKEISSKRQNLFFSATYPEKVLGIVKRISSAPEHIKIEDDTPTVENIHQRVIEVNKDNRGMLLRHLIVMEKWKNALVFVSSKTAAGNLAEKLKKVGVKAGALHGDLSQPERNKALSDFKDKKVDFLVATDVASRGIDISKLSLVINFDLPRSPADYIHRIGRTGRAGEKGLAVTFIGHEDQEHFKLIEKRAQVYLEREQVPGFELTGEAINTVKGQAPVKGAKKSKKDKARELAQKIKK